MIHQFPVISPFQLCDIEDKSTDSCVFKKCCKKYKEGKRCKKCPKS